MIIIRFQIRSVSRIFQGSLVTKIYVIRTSHKLSSWKVTLSGVVLQQLLVTQLVKKFPPSVKVESPCPYAGRSTTGPCFESLESTQALETCLFKVRFNINI
jgi:hypothetical protein